MVVVVGSSGTPYFLDEKMEVVGGGKGYGSGTSRRDYVEWWVEPIVVGGTAG